MFEVSVLVLVQDAEPLLAGRTEPGAKVDARGWVGVRGLRAGNHGAVGYDCEPPVVQRHAPCRAAQQLAEEGGGITGQNPVELHGGVVGSEAEFSNGGLPWAEVRYCPSW